MHFVLLSYGLLGMRAVVVGNAPTDVHIQNVTHLVVFNQLYHLSRWYFSPCPPRILHYYNFLFRDRVLKRHAMLRDRCPGSNVTLHTTDDAAYLPPSAIPSESAKCFKRHSTKPWSIGFFILARYAYYWPSQIGIAAFTHQVWNGHPNECERSCVDEWVQSGRLIRVQ